MKVWLLHIGEDLPVDGPTRPFRYSYLAQALQEKGHQVLRWAPTFRHNNKNHRFSSDARIAITENYSIQFVHSPGYRRNASWERLRTYCVLGRRFRDLAERETPPDLIVAAIPSLEWAEAAIDYGRTRQIPVVIDVRDLWPDVFLNAIPKTVHPIGRYLLAPYYRIAQRVCRQATALTAVSQSYLQWAIKLAERHQDYRDTVLPLGFEPDPMSAAVLQKKVAELRKYGIDPSQPICMFAGLFERSYDLETLVEAAQRLSEAGRRDMQFVLCGDGGKMPMIRRRAKGLRNVHLLGWVDTAMLQAVASISTIGLCAYASDALQSLPNKPFDYMAARLAIVSSLRGEMASLLNQHQCGLTYRAGDAESLASCLTELLEHPTQLREMGTNAYQAWSRNFRSRDIYTRFVSHLETLTCAAAQAA